MSVIGEDVPVLDPGRPDLEAEVSPLVFQVLGDGIGCERIDYVARTWVVVDHPIDEAQAEALAAGGFTVTFLSRDGRMHRYLLEEHAP